MAVRIFEMSRMHLSGNGGGSVLPNVPWAVSQTPITPTGTAAQSAAFGSATNAVTVQADEAVHVAFGSNPTATTSDYKIEAGGERDFWVTPGHKMSVRTA